MGGKMTGRSLELFFINGEPDGMATAEVFGWTGHVLRTPRLQIKSALQRPEAGYTGVYVLLEKSEEGGRIYIGEAENVGQRLRDHVANKDWWGTALLVTTAGDALHKAHVKYLESRLVEAARISGSKQLENGNTPPRSSLNEAARTNMETFFETLMMVFPALGINAFQTGLRLEDPEPAVPDFRGNEGPKFLLQSDKHGTQGIATLEGSEFVVQKGSVGRPEWVSKTATIHSYQTLFEKLVADGVIAPSGDHSTFTKSYAFKSPSAAAAVLIGRPSNGRMLWKTEDGRTFDEFERDLLTEITP